MNYSAFANSVRLRNLLALHALAKGFGSPTTGMLLDFLQRNNVPVDRNLLTMIYQESTMIDDQLSGSIEVAFKLPNGWLSSDHSFIFKLSPSQLQSHSNLENISSKTRDTIYSLIDQIAAKEAEHEHTRNQVDSRIEPEASRSVGPMDQT